MVTNPKFKLPGLEFVDFIGSGGFGSVYKYRNSFYPSKLYAVKQVQFVSVVKQLRNANITWTEAKAMEKAEKLMLREVQIQYLIEEQERTRKTEEWNIPVFYFVSADPDSSKDFLFISEYCEKSNLASIIAESLKTKIPLQEQEILRIFYGVLKAVRVMHNLKIAHRDIAANNIMFDAKNVPKLIDFGAGRIADNAYSQSTMVFTKAFYSAPELDDPNYVCTDDLIIKGDIWQLGIVLYEMLDPPLFQRKISLIQTRNFSLLAKAPYSKEIKALVEKICVDDPTKRPTVDEILQDGLFQDLKVIN